MVFFHAAGRLGNHHFMMANVLAYSLRHGLEFTAPSRTSHDYWSPLYLHHLVNPNFNPSLPAIQIDEKHFHYEEIPFDESWRNMNILMNGYWQSEKYFLDYKDDVIKLFNYPWHLEEDVCAIHARFGDYLSIKGKHIVVDEDYLTRAMDIIKAAKGIKRFRVYSDDIAYFKQNFGQLYDFEYSEGKSIEQDLIDISCCHSQIMSSSTFSFWGAYLNKNPDKIVVCNKQWFQDGWKDEYQRIVDTKDIYPDDNRWIKI